MKSTIITGAGTGIGAAAAGLLSEQGHAVCLVGRRAEKLDEVASDIRKSGGKCITVAADVADPSCFSVIVSAAANAFGGISGVVNNAATIKTMPFVDYSLEIIDYHWAVNIRAPFLLTQSALPWLIRSRGAVVNISSSSGTLVRSGQSLYGMSKAALEYLTKSCAGEFAKQGVRFNSIAFGPVDTPIHESWASDLKEAYEWLAGQVPLGRIASAQEAAQWIAILLSDQASYVTGVVLPVDGGQVLDIT
ncbi:MAG: SDR family NAD(P)-dependent oxidoreductase [Alphaproteobacteria bacterium]|nr:SDR family NAD(P)-dependent oxidoreductase [Alphaproteobacteria bacterium]